MPLPVQNARISKQIHDAYNVVGRFRAQVDEVVVPVCLIDDLTRGAGGYAETRRASASFLQGAVALEQGLGRFETPPGILAVIRQVVVRSSASTGMAAFFGSSIAAPASTAPKAYIDGRLRSRGETPAGVLTFDTAVAGLAVVHWIMPVSASNALNVVDVEWPIGQLGAFDFMEFNLTVLNAFFQLSLVWDEYLIRP